MASPVSRLTLATTVQARLETVPHASVYLGQVPDQPPTLPNSDKVAPYVALFSGDGSPIDEAPLTADVTGSVDWPFQVTCAAGYMEHLLRLLDDVHTVLDGWIPAAAGVQFGPVRQRPGYDAGPARTDTQVEPARLYLPCQYLLTAATA